MPVKNYLNLEQKVKLQKALKEEENPEIRERILIFLLLNDGKTQSEIANFLGCSLKKVNHWCVHIELSSSQVTRLLAKKNYVYIWAKQSLEDKWNKNKRQVFKKKLKEYLKLTKKSPKLLQLWFWDESGFSLRVIKRKNWTKKADVATCEVSSQG